MTRQRIQREENRSNATHKLGVYVGLAIVMILLGVLLAISTANTVGEIAAWIDPEARALMLQEEAAMLPARVNAQKWALLAGIVLRWLLIVILAAGAFVGLTWAWRASRRHYARDGLYPVIEVQNGSFYDPNRDNAGASPLVAAGALAVQERAADYRPAGMLPAPNSQRAFRMRQEPGLMGVMEATQLEQAMNAGLIAPQLADAIEGQWREVEVDDDS